MSARRGDPLARLVRWLAANGATFPRVALRREADGSRGARARAAIPPGDDVLSVPRRLLVTDACAQASPIGAQLAAAGVQPDSSQTYLALFLLAEREARDSRWRPYLDALPAAFDRHPLYYGDAELALLRGSAALAMIARQRADLHAEHAALCARVPALARFSFADLCWARLAVLTRVFTIALDGAPTEALVPLADMLDHASAENTAWDYRADRDAFVMHATHALRGGDALRDSYGRKPNRRFFVHYGFCLDANPDDDARLVLPDARAIDVSARADDPRVRALFSRLRLGCATADERRLAPPRGFAGERVPPLTAHNERRVLAVIGAAARAALARFDTTLAADDALLAAGALPTRARLCVAMRASEKRVLHAFGELADVAAPLLALPRDAFARAARELPAAHGPLVRGYVEGLVRNLDR